MRVLLVNAPNVQSYQRQTRISDIGMRPPPLHLGYLAAVLEHDGMEVAITDLAVRNQADATLQAVLLDQAPDLVGISSTTASFPVALRLAQLSKEILPNVPIVLGGSHVTFTAAETLRENACVDMVVRGEGERTLQELVACLQAGQCPERVAGVTWRQNGGIVHNPPRPFIQDLDSLPWPARHLMNLKEPYNMPGALFTSRGCPGRCIFCPASAMSGHRYRARQPERVVDEIEYLHDKLGFQQLAILDDTFTAMPKKLTLPVCREIKRRGLQVAWFCESRVDVATPEVLDALREAGCEEIQFGVESGSPQVLATLRKGITLEQVRRAIRHAVELGMKANCSLILGHPDETEEDVRLTMDFMREIRQMGAHLVVLTFLTPYPGTDIYERRAAYDITLHETQWTKYTGTNPIISTRHLSRDRMLQLWVEAQTNQSNSAESKEAWNLLK